MMRPRRGTTAWKSGGYVCIRDQVQRLPDYWLYRSRGKIDRKTGQAAYRNKRSRCRSDKPARGSKYQLRIGNWCSLSYICVSMLCKVAATKNMKCRVKGDFHAQFCGKAGVRFPCLTRL